MDFPKYTEIADIIKGFMKTHGITYSDLSKMSKTSVSTIKKRLNADDMSFNKLMELCDVLGITKEDLFEGDTRSVYEFRLSKSQESLFLKNYKAFKLYWLIAFERLSYKELSKLDLFSKGELDKLLLILDKENLIHLFPGNKIKGPSLKPVKWLPKTPFSKKIYEDWAGALLDDAIEGVGDSKVNLQRYKLTTNSIQELCVKLDQIEDEFAKRTIREMKLYPKKVKDIRLLIASGKGKFF